MCVHFLGLGSALACANQSSFCGLALVSHKGVPGSLATENATPPSTLEPTGRNWARWVPFHHVSSSGTELIRLSSHLSNRSIPSPASLLLAHRSLTQPLLSPSCGFTLARLNTLSTHRASFVPGSSMVNAGCYPRFYLRRCAPNTSPTPVVLAHSHMITLDQAIPCQVTGRGIGIIDFAQYHTTILDAVAVLEAGASHFYLLSSSHW